MLDEFAWGVFDKFASSKAAISAFLLVEFARRANSSLKLGTLLDSVNAPLVCGREVYPHLGTWEKVGDTGLELRITLLLTIVWQKNHFFMSSP
jgi:hypothetical protein